jgi:large subunit ribosomal protein L25
VKTGGGVLEHVLFKIKVCALPKDLPEQIIVDVTSLELGKSIHLGDLKAPAGVEILGDKKVSVISVALPKTEVEEAAAAEAEPAAPGDVEMIKEKKEEGEEAAPAKGEKAGAKGAEKGAAKGAEKAGAKPGEKAPAAAAAGDKKAAAPAEKKK